MQFIRHPEKFLGADVADWVAGIPDGERTAGPARASPAGGGGDILDKANGAIERAHARRRERGLE